MVQGFLRVLIFAHMRSSPSGEGISVRDLARGIREEATYRVIFKGVLRVRTIVLISNDLSDGMTQRLQEEVIANFRSGTINLLVSTTVGEEGIDIPDCKYVIKYDVVGNEIASVQSRGRVRDKEGKYEVVAGKESGVIEKENLNVIREVMMQEAIKEVKAMAQQEYVAKVRVQKKETL